MSLVGPRPLVLAEHASLERVLAGPPRRPAPRPHRPVADLRPLPHPVPGHDQVRLPVRGRLVAGARHRDPPRDAPGRDLRSGRVLIDLHCHALPGVDDGPATLEDSLALLRAAHAAGAKTVVATPHVSPALPDDARADRRADGRAARRSRPSSCSRAPRSRTSRRWSCRTRCCAGSRSVTRSRILLESPLSPSVGPVFERAFESLQERGYRVLLAHPERAAISSASRSGCGRSSSRARCARSPRVRSPGASARVPSGSRSSCCATGSCTAWTPTRTT